jgi:hypothetical protein
MGDPARFRLFAETVEQQFSDRTAQIADVAAGKGYLQAALYQRGYRNIVSWDKRPRNAKNRHGYHYGYFDYRSAPRGYDLVIGMHPDEGTDHIIQYACKHRIPFIVCPCCVKPSASRFQDIGYDGWLRHLIGLAEAGRMNVEVFSLPMEGRKQVIVGRPMATTDNPTLRSVVLVPDKK